MDDFANAQFPVPGYGPFHFPNPPINNHRLFSGHGSMPSTIAQDTLQGNTTVCLSMNFLDNTPSHHSRGFS
jgi:hypothetical protein